MMTDTEIIEIIKTIKANYPDECYSMLRDALNIAIEALEQYKPQHVNNIKWHNLNTFGDCPNCGTRVYQRYHPNYCGVCSQAVKWE